MTAAEALLSPKDADGRAVEPLARALSARAVSRPERLRLVGLLGRTGSERALSTLLPLLQSVSDPALAEAAAMALGTISSKSSGSALLTALDSDEVRVKRAAAVSIRQGRSAELVGPLLKRLARGGRAERTLAYLALPGPLSQSRDDQLIAQVAKLLDETRGGERDELLEALSASSRPPARAALLRLAKSSDFADRSKAAELLAAAPDVPALTRLVHDADARVRANAAWSLGFAAAGEVAAARQSLILALKDREAEVSGNAAVSLGRLARGHSETAIVLCGALLRDRRASVREQALRGLGLAHANCSDGYPALLLASDPRARVRRAAAELLLRASPEVSERRLLMRCQEGDTHATVAETCAGAPRADVPDVEATSVMVLQSTAAEPTPFTPFALLWADGGLRLGNADRRGVVHEPRAPKGSVELLPYAGGD
jgi:HEAT repeat protein